MASRALRIALVEDNPMVLAALDVGLQSLGHQVVAAANKADLLARLDRIAPDIVVSDYRLMQGETGLGVIASVRGHFAGELPAVLITGDTDPRLVRRMSERGLVVLHKPLDLEALQRAIEGLTVPA